MQLPPNDHGAYEVAPFFQNAVPNINQSSFFIFHFVFPNFASY